MGCYQYYRHAEAGLPVYRNVTKRYNCAPEPQLVRPYERYHENHPAEGLTCVPGDMNCPGLPDEGEAGYECCELPDWRTAQPSGPLLSGVARVQRGNFYNDFVAEEGTQSFAACFKAGFKNVFARKFWCGINGYLDSDDAGAHGFMPDHFSWCGACSVQEYKPTPPTTKYRKISGTSWVEYNGTEDWQNFRGDASGWAEIGRLTGEVTGHTECSGSNVGGDAATARPRCEYGLRAVEFGQSRHYGGLGFLPGAVVLHPESRREPG